MPYIGTQKGFKWWRESVSQVLRKTAYYGEVTGSAGIPVAVPVIVSRQLWDEAHAALARNRIARVGRPSKALADGKGFSRQYLLTGFLWCRKCGARCRTFPAPKGDAAYRCGGIDGTSHKRLCNAGSVRKSRLEPVVWDAICDTLTNPDLLWSMIVAHHERWRRSPRGRRTHRSSALRGTAPR